MAGKPTAVITYSGNNTLANVREHETKLRRWLEKQSGLNASGKSIIAQYDPPWVIPFLKKNEIMMSVAGVGI